MQKTADLSPSFAATRLVRLLDAWTPVQRDASMDVAERASLWFSAFDAIRLQAVHQSVRGTQAKPQDARQADGGTIAAEVQRVRTVLAAAIGQELPDPQATPAFAPYHRRHLELQRSMELAIAPLREQVRQAAARASVRLRRLALLDEAMEQVIAAREQALLPTVAALLERRFVQLRSDAPAPDDDLAAPRRPGGWQHAFEADWRQALLCELDLRLEPVTGLLEALAHDLKH